MAEPAEIRVPDIGDFSEVPVIEVLVEVGDRIRPEDPIVTLESDKATMDVPSPVAGRVAGIALSVGDLVSEGALILTLDPAGSVDGATPAESPRAGPSAEAAESADAAPGQVPDASTSDPRSGPGRSDRRNGARTAPRRSGPCRASCRSDHRNNVRPDTGRP